MREKIVKCRKDIFKMADSMASREEPVSDPSERRFNAGMEAE